MQQYQNRQQAGKILADLLKSYADRKDAIVLALPRGGVPVAYEIANALNLPLDVFIVRKLGVPGHDELAMGAIAMGGITVFNDNVINDLNISQHAIETVIKAEQEELDRRVVAYRSNKPYPIIKDKIVILVDDGIATGATIRAAIKALRKLEPANIIIAVPVAEITTCKELTKLADKIVCPQQPSLFYAVGSWYEDFSQTTDHEVCELLRK